MALICDHLTKKYGAVYKARLGKFYNDYTGKGRRKSSGASCLTIVNTKKTWTVGIKYLLSIILVLLWWNIHPSVLIFVFHTSLVCQYVSTSRYKLYWFVQYRCSWFIIYLVHLFRDTCPVMALLHVHVYYYLSPIWLNQIPYIWVPFESIIFDSTKSFILSLYLDS